ncbi:MAG: hypothetical protein U0414_33240 [Polyangiaceae bacterium]
MTTVVQKPGVAMTPTERVACAIYCCDKKKYNLPNSRGGRKTCQRIGNRKHSCVLHALRKHTKSGKLTTKNKYAGVKASPRFPKGKRTLIPDTIVNGNKVIDAKFPCETKDVHGPGDKPKGKGPGFTTGKGKKAYPSDSRRGTVMLTSKEKSDYKKINGIKKVEAMTPADAKTAKGKNCKCPPNP